MHGKVLLFGLIYATLCCLNAAKTDGMCANAYKEICGKRPFKEGEPTEYLDTMEEVMQNYQKKLAAGFEARRKIGEKESKEIYKKIRDYYDACRSTTEFDVAKYFKALQAQDSSFEWLNILHDQNLQLPDDWDWLKALAKLGSYNFDQLPLNFNVEVVNKNYMILNILKPNRFKPVEFQETELMDLKTAKPDMQTKVKNFEMNLEALYEGYRGSRFIPTNVKDLSKVMPAEHIREYLEIYYGEKLDDFTAIGLYSDYWKSFSDTLKATPKKVLAYYLALKFASYLRSQMPKGNESLDCIIHMQKPFSNALELVYEQQLDDIEREKTEFAIEKIFKALKQKLLARLSKQFTDKTLMYLEEKVVAMQITVGLNLSSSTEEVYNNFYKDLQISNSGDNAFYTNNLNALKYLVRESLELLKTGKTSIKTSDGFNRYTNLITIPRYLLQLPLYDVDFTSHTDLEFGGAGLIIAAQMFNTFSPPDLFFDAQGNENEYLPYFSGTDTERSDNLFRCELKTVYEAFSEAAGGSLNEIEKKNFFITTIKAHCINKHADKAAQQLKISLESIDDFFDVFKCPKGSAEKYCSL